MVSAIYYTNMMIASIILSATEYWTFKDPSANDTTLQCSAEGEDERCSLSVPSDGINEAHLEVSSHG